MMKIYLSEKNRFIGDSNFDWLLDNGHGKWTNEKQSPKTTPQINHFLRGNCIVNGRFKEYIFNRIIVSLLCEMLRDANISFCNLVPEINIGNALKMRVTRANNLCHENSIYLSIHSNAYGSGWTQPSGAETWCHNKSFKGKELAGYFQKELVSIGFKDRGVKMQKKNFFVLRATDMPAVLTESGFYTNAVQVWDLTNPDVQYKIALAHFNAILKIENSVPRWF